MLINSSLNLNVFYELVNVLYREACLEFKDLCKKKLTDTLWMDELAAMAACPPSELPYLGTSGIILTSEGNNTDGGMYSLYLFLLAPLSIACFDPTDFFN